ncbi:MAG: RNA polymerase sigma factor [Eubacteriales bacterium]|nr:RNA polymerase sigma factor [Eubacteriales bacterium]
MQAESLTDEEMIIRIQQGEELMLECLIRKYYDDVYWFCCYKTGDGEQAYDCAQETFLKLTRYIYSYRERKKFRGYLFSIARNICNDYFRTRPEDIPDSDSLLSIPHGKDMISQAETAQVVRAALKLLKEEQREVVYLRYYCGFKLREIAKIVGIPLPTAKSRLKRGMGRLKEILEKEGIGYER